MAVKKTLLGDIDVKDIIIDIVKNKSDLLEK